MSKKLTREFFTGNDTLETARNLLGKTLVVLSQQKTRLAGKIVEVEAYLGEIDKAAHSYQGRRTKRNDITFEIGGKVYVFFIYGRYWQLNFVTNIENVPHVCLIRAVEPLEGIETMRENRGLMKDLNLTSGPGKLCLAFGIDRSFNGEDLLDERIWVEEGEKLSPKEIACGKRIGIDYAEEFAEKPWRFWVKDNPFVSRK